jgi:MFS transporter, FHS family, Na+ dependent glucose transporter 1
VTVTRRRNPAPTYLISFVAIGAAFAMAGPALVLLERQVGADTGQIGIVFSAVGLGYLLSSFAAAKGYDRGWGNRLMAGALLVLCASLLWIPQTTTLAALTAAFFVNGAAVAAVDVGANTLLVWWTAPSSGSWLAALHFCFGLGALLMPIVVWLSQASRDDVALACWLLALLAAVGATAVALTRTPEHPVMSSAEPSAETDAVPARRRLVGWTMVFFSLYVGVEVGFGAWIYTYATEIGLSAAVATGLTTAFWAAFTIGRLLSILLARSFGAFRLVVCSSLLGAAAMIAFVAAGGAVAVIWPATVVLGLAVAPQFPLMIAFAGTSVNLAASTTAWFIATAGIAGLTLPWAIGQLIDRIGPSTMPATILALALGTLFALWRIAAAAERRGPLRRSREAPAGAIASR